jgi:hypothetical protein
VIYLISEAEEEDIFRREPSYFRLFLAPESFGKTGEPERRGGGDSMDFVYYR